MKIIRTTHNGIVYEFRYLEASNIIEITKSGTFTYLIDFQKGRFDCNCPGAKYHKKCWHRNMIPQLFDALSLDEPWACWAEEVGRMMYGNY